MEIINTLIHVPINDIQLEGDLIIPPNAKSIIIFVHGSGSSRLSTRNIYVAELLQKKGFATLLFDLLTRAEDEIYENRFNIPLLVERISTVTSWLAKNPSTKNLSKGYFGASTGAAAAIIAACQPNNKIKSVVSRGGRPDLAGDYLADLQAPTLLIVGGSDYGVIELNQEAYLHIRAPKRISIVPNATHLFEEPGTLEQVANLACEWFRQYLV